MTSQRSYFFPEASDNEWNDFRWQLKNRVATFSSLSKLLRLSDEELAAFGAEEAATRFSVTPYYLSLIDPDDPDDPSGSSAFRHPASSKTAATPQIL